MTIDERKLVSLAFNDRNVVNTNRFEYYVKKNLCRNWKRKLKIIDLPFLIWARKIRIAFASKKAIKITKFVLNYL